ncbi:hypothetical protein R1sor_001724 [Riccia sorocarpa]|uniref:Uncharacterized protein n=1 Tax=Riccia sorocarpa TaxID=122646 RepID=A0ABD3GWR0_9MARC
MFKVSWPFKAKTLEQNSKAADEAAPSTRFQVQKELDHLKHGSIAAKTTIGRLEADLKVAHQDVSTRAKQEEDLKARLKSVTGEMEVQKVGSEATKSKLREELLGFQQQLQTHKASGEKFKAAFDAELQKTASLDEQIVVLKGQGESQKFVADRAEKAESTLRSELSKVKTELRMLQLAGN